MSTGIWGGKVSAATRRRQKVARATPRWLTPDQWREIHQFYCRAKYMNRTWRSEQRERQRYRNFYSVDHIVPLDGNKLVCGLHVPWNLRVMERLEDCRKGDKLEAALTVCASQTT